MTVEVFTFALTFNSLAFSILTLKSQFQAKPMVSTSKEVECQRPHSEYLLRQECSSVGTHLQCFYAITET